MELPGTPLTGQAAAPSTPPAAAAAQQAALPPAASGTDLSALLNSQLLQQVAGLGCALTRYCCTWWCIKRRAACGRQQ